MGVIEKVRAQVGEAGWTERPVILITDGGQKTRAGNKTSTDVYAGLWRLPGSQFANLREGALLNTLAIAATTRYLTTRTLRFRVMARA